MVSWWRPEGKPSFVGTARVAEASGMKCTIALTVLFMAAGAPVLAAGSPEQLVQALTQAARQGDVDGFLVSMSTGTQRH